MTMQITKFPSRWLRRIGVLVFVVAALLTVFFGLGTCGSFLLLRSAYEAGARGPAASELGWLSTMLPPRTEPLMQL
jgi:hypothetical protein